ncbi:RagB/SusD family nutrient uptake outer membrane protein [Chitinophaga sp. Hz27]|uniref:RagB/SusD family nutrient uptake outer membrane protein n=1 Tax=Chitinophaga sp. Hz27 TaxID=3347169 RepID=UPI0035DDC305
MTKNIFRTALAASICLGLASCSLKEDLGSTLTKSQADSVITVESLLKNAYNSLQMPYQDFSNSWGMSEMSTDEAVGPTRAGDWDDNGVWRQLHEHTWTADHSHIQGTFNSLLQLQFAATNVMNFHPTAKQAAEARFLRALSMYTTLDLWGQVPFRNPGDNLLNAPKVLKPQETIDFMISELKAIIPDLPGGMGTPAYQANQSAAKFLLMKIYLNKGAFLNRKAPTFDAGDMQSVISYADEITTAGYSLANNYFDNFAYNNDALSTENIFTQQNGPGLSTVRSGNSAYARWKFTLHYNQDPSGWNGFATLSDFYDSFEAADTRRGGPYTIVTANSGLNVGFLVGQQYDKNGVALKDRKGNMLSFTREVALKETGNNLEVTGIRVLKYPPDFVTSNGKAKDGNDASNDYVFFRYADVLLMKAEALLRTGQNGPALIQVNMLRAQRGATNLGTLDLNSLLAERGRELYWEGWRRQDLIRFGKFLDPWQLKTQDDPRNLLFPIPTSALAVNKNLSQNTGY